MAGASFFRQSLILVRRFAALDHDILSNFSSSSEMPEIIKEEWWLMDSSFPNLNWARLQVFSSGASEVLDMDGEYHHFQSELDAKYWLWEDEFRALHSLGEEDEKEFEIDLSQINPPKASTDEEIVNMMYVLIESP